jgi:3-methyladenine DNA glycosylase AlkC
MFSISSKKSISTRAIQFWKKYRLWRREHQAKDLQLIYSFLEDEYKTIPETERIGKGSVYVTKVIADATIDTLVNSKFVDPLQIINLIFHFHEVEKSYHMKNYALALLAKYATMSKKTFTKAVEIVKITVKHCAWEVREQCGIVIRETIKKYPKETLELLGKWTDSPDENLRRISIESIRPFRDIAWLRDPEKNDKIIDLLAKLKDDDSLYVRKSVGNNLKDLSKYMPNKILTLLKEWVEIAKINVTTDLASKSKKELGNKNYNLIWTMKHALRWLKERNPEYHKQIEGLLGKNYILYYHEKRNKMAVKR